MQRVLTTQQMKNADNYTITKLGIPEEVLVKRAGHTIASVIIDKFNGGRVLVCVGKGNNGADGRVVADILLKTSGFNVEVFDASCGANHLLEEKFDIIVDCIFGTGLSRAVQGKYKEVVEFINKSGAFIVSCDIPSGISGDTGLVQGDAVKADITVAIQEYKLGHFLNDGLDYSGELIVKDIGISLLEEDYVFKLDDEDVSNYFKPRKHKVNKGNFGKVAVFGGSKKYFGSALLSASSLASLKTGAGYSYLYIPESLYTVYAGVNPECIIGTFTDKDGEILFCEENLKQLLEFKSIAIGMGLGVSEETYKTVCYFVKNYKGRLVIDADGLNSLANYGVDVLKEKCCEIVLTPHIGEFSRLIGKTVSEIVSNSVGYAKEFANKYGITLLLKSACSVITNGEKVFINTTGNSGLAKAGSGDVLSGFLAGMLLRDDNPLILACVSAYVFGKAGEIASCEQNEYTVTASDVVKALPKAINSLN